MPGIIHREQADTTSRIALGSADRVTDAKE